MALPFTADQFFEVFRLYNDAVWPFQFALNGLALAALVMVLVPVRHSHRLVSLALALLWAWTGVAYHLAFFSAINPAAYGFAALFLAGALAFAWYGAVRGRLVYRCDETARSSAGLALITYALLVYPLIALALGRGYPDTATFGLPCPTVIFSLGLLAFVRPPAPRLVFAAPLVWAAIASQAAALFRVYEDLGLLVAGIAGVWFLLGNRSNPMRHA